MGKLAATALIAASFFGGWWTVDNINWDLFYPKQQGPARLFRHVYNDAGTVRMLQEFDREDKTWKNVQVDWVQPEPLKIDMDYLGLRHVPNDGQEGLGQGAGGLDPNKWHGGNNE